MIIKLDGKYIPKSGWTGPIGKLLQKINQLKRLSTFPALADTNEIREMPPEIVQTLSTDQKNSYNLIPPVKQGKLDDQLAKIICGELSTARWCTTGEALLML